ncbi:major facilitator superfamily domain-containing protein [Aspergillus californicus]
MAVPSQNSSCRACQHHDTGDTASVQPWKLELRSSRSFVTWVVAIAVFTDVFIYGMIIPILPEVLKTRVSVPEDELQKWMSILLAAFGGALLVGSPIFGHFADKSSSRQAPFLIGLLALGGSTVMFWFAGTVSELVIARVLQGLSAAVVWTVGMALIVDTVGKDQVGTAMGIVSMAMTVGTVFGPFVGGLVLSKAGYHAVFGTAMGLIVLDIVLRLVMVERKSALKWIDAQSTTTETATETGDEAEAEETTRLLDPTTLPKPHPRYDGKSTNEDNPTEPTHKAKRGSMPGIMRMLCSSTLLTVLLATLIHAISYSSFDSVLPLYTMSTFHLSPMGIGLCFVPLFLPSFLSTLIGKAVDKHGSRKIACVGFLLDLPIFCLLQFVTENTTRDLAVLYILLFFAGLAAALKTVALMVEVSLVVEARERECPGIFGDKGGTAQAYGLFNVAWSGGQVAGPLVAGWLVEWFGWGVMVCVFGGLGGAMAGVLGAKGVIALKK